MHPPSPHRQIARVIVFHKERLLLIRRHNSHGKYYVLPGGGIEDGEQPGEAAVREAFEETSISVRLIRQVYDDHSPQFGHTAYFLAKYLNGEPAVNPESVEALHNAKGKDMYQPLWLEDQELAKINLLPETIKFELLLALDQGFPKTIKTLAL